MATDEMLPRQRETASLSCSPATDGRTSPETPIRSLPGCIMEPETEIEQAIDGTNTLVVYADTDFAGENDDTEISGWQALKPSKRALKTNTITSSLNWSIFRARTRTRYLPCVLKPLSRFISNMENRCRTRTGQSHSEPSSREEGIFTTR